MAHRDKGKYFEKHPHGTKISDDLKQAILQAAKDGNIACGAAEKIAGRLQVSMGEVGVGIDILNINIVACQLGLFGYDSGRKRVTAAASVLPELEEAIREGLVDGQLSCAAAWDIAGELRVGREEVCAACEHLKIKVKPCQLGAF